MWNKEFQPVSELKKIRNGPCLALLKRGGPAQKSTGKVVADIEYGGKDDFSIEEKDGENYGGMYVDAMGHVTSSSSSSSSSSSAAAAAAAEAANDDVDEGDDGDEMDIDDNDEGESIYSCDEENDGSDDEGTSKENLDEVIEKPDAAIGVHAGAPTPARSDVDIIRSVLDVNHVGEEHLSVEAISIPPPDILKSVTPVFDTSTSNVTSTVEREGEGEGEVVFWHMGDTTEDLMERARVIALTPIKAEEVVVRVKVAVEVGVEVGVVEVSPEAKEEAQEQEHGLGQGQKQQQELNLTDNTLTTMKSEYDDTRSNMEITRSELDCEKKSE